MIPLLYATVFILALLGGFFGALLGDYLTGRALMAKVEELFPVETPKPAKVMALVKPPKVVKREEAEWKDAPGPISPSEEKRKKAKMPIPEED